MRVHGTLFALAFAPLLASCVTDSSSGEGPGGKADDSSTSWKFDTDHKLDKAFLRTTNPELSDAGFDAKWNGALQGVEGIPGPLLFMRSFPGGFHKDLTSLLSPAVPGPEGICLGDAHVGNFGFLQIEGNTVFSFNDLDDSGFCPIALDAARYFAVLQVFFHDDKLTKSAIDQYMKTLTDPTAAVPIDPASLPNWTKVQTKGVAKLTTAGSATFNFDPTNPDTSDLSAPTSQEVDAIKAGIASSPVGQATLLDVASVAREFGGSGGLRRYLLLVDSGGQRSVIELKETTTPAVELGRHEQTLPGETRVATLKTTFWHATNPANDGDYYNVEIAGSPFLVRNKYTKKSVDAYDSTNMPQVATIMAQVSQMALIHQPGWSTASSGELAQLQAWLGDGAMNLAQRWEGAYTVATAP